MGEPEQDQIRIEADHAYFLYVGEIKAAGLNAFLVPVLSRRYGKPVRCIHVVPDVLSCYPDPHYLVVNPEASRLGVSEGLPVNCRLPLGRFAEEVSCDRGVLNLVERILAVQEDLFVNVFETRPELRLPGVDRVRIIGPEPHLAEKINSKTWQYHMARSLGIRVAEGATFDSVPEAAGHAGEIIGREGRVFVSAEYSSAGSNSMIATDPEQILERFGAADRAMLVTRYVPHTLDPTVLGIVAGPGQVYIASVADQVIRGTRFVGSTFPTVLGPEQVDALKDDARTIGEHLARLGYRGTFGCDFMVGDRGDIYFVEINARKQGTTMETALTMVHRLPDQPSFPELELMAVTGEGFPAGIREMDSRQGPVFWGTYNYKTEADAEVLHPLEPGRSEAELFAAAAEGGGGHIVLDHVGPGVRVKKGGFVGRVVAAAGSHRAVAKGLERGVAEIDRSLGVPAAGLRPSKRKKKKEEKR